MYMAVQYAFVGIAQTWKNKTHACNNQTATNESTAQKPVFSSFASDLGRRPGEV